MNNHLHFMNRFAVVIMLCCVVVTLSAFTLPAQAETIRVVSPQTNMYMTASPVSQTVHVNSQANITFSWYDGGAGTTVFIVDWRDGHSDSYRCGFNCGSGSFTYGHVYTKTGTYIAKGYLDSDSSVAAWSTVKVI